MLLPNASKDKSFNPKEPFIHAIKNPNPITKILSSILKDLFYFSFKILNIELSIPILSNVNAFIPCK